MSNSHPAEFNPSVASTSIHFGDHLELVRQLLILADECLLVSPFLFEDFSPLFEGLSLESLKVELISTCAPRGGDQLTKPFSLKSFGCILETLTGNWPTINLVKNLHSKVYIFWKNGVPFAGLVTSANLTRSGLSLNHETGILLSNKELLAELAQRARQTLDYVSLNEYQLDKLCAVAEIYIRDRGPDNVREEIGLTNLLELYATPSAGNRNTKLRESANYFIKVSGVRDRPILPEERWPFDEPHGELTFAKNPKRINLGDCLIEVAVGGLPRHN